MAITEDDLIKLGYPEVPALLALAGREFTRLLTAGLPYSHTASLASTILKHAQRGTVMVELTGGLRKVSEALVIYCQEISKEDFDPRLEQLISTLSAANILAYGEVYAFFRAEFEVEVLEAVAQDRALELGVLLED